MARSEPTRSAARRRRLALFLVITALTAGSVLFIGIGSNNALLPSGSHDLQWTPARSLANGVNPYGRFMQWKADGHKLTPPHFLNQSPSYPASVYVLLAPITLLDWETAKLTWLVFNLTLLALIIVALQKTFPIQSPLLLFVVTATFLCCSPLRESLGAGQINLLSLASFLWSYHFSQKPGSHYKGLSGLLLAVSWVKYSITFPLTLILINQRRWQPIVIAVVIHTVLTTIAAIRLNLWPHEFFLSSVEVVLMGQGTGFINLSALAMKLNLPTSLAIGTIIITMALVSVQISTLPKADPNKLLALLTLLSFAVFYHHHYDFIVLIILAWCLARCELTHATKVSTIALLSVAWGALWLSHELLPLLGETGAVINAATEILLVAACYSTLVLLTIDLNQNRNAAAVQPRSVLAF